MPLCSAQCGTRVQKPSGTTNWEWRIRFGKLLRRRTRRPTAETEYYIFLTADRA